MVGQKLPRTRPRDVVEQLKTHNKGREISYFIAYGEADDEVSSKITVADHRGYSTRVLQNLENLAFEWRRVEFFSKKDHVVYVHKRCEDDEKDNGTAGEIEDIKFPSNGSGRAQELGALMNAAATCIIRAQSSALEQQRGQTKDLLDGYAGLAQRQMETLEQQRQTNADMLRVQTALQARLVETRIEQADRYLLEAQQHRDAAVASTNAAIEAAGAGEGTTSLSEKFMEGLLPEIGKRIPAWLASMGDGKPASSATNGASSTTTNGAPPKNGAAKSAAKQ